jgi:malonyl-CoA O-methyltransferase
MTAPRKLRVANAFDRANDYERHADIQRIVAERLASRIIALDIDVTAPALEIGCGTGFLTKALLDRWSSLRLTVNDVAPSMLDRTRSLIGERNNVRYLLFDAERLTAAPASFGLIVSSLAFQWFDHPAGTANRLAHMLRPGGWLAFSTLDAGSFREWLDAQRGAGLPGLTRDYPEADFFAEIKEPFQVGIDRYTLRQSYPNGLEFLRSLKAIGAATPWSRGASSGTRSLRKAIDLFERQGSTVTYEIAEIVIRREA